MLLERLLGAMLDQQATFSRLPRRNRRNVAIAVGLFYVGICLLTLIAFRPIFTDRAFFMLAIAVTAALFGGVLDVAVILRPQVRRYYGTGLVLVILVAGAMGFILGFETRPRGLIGSDVDLGTTLFFALLWLLAFLSLVGAVGLYSRAAREIFTAKAQVDAEIQLAQRVQKQLLPPLAIERPRIEAHGLTRAAYEVGGDYLDAIPLDENRLIVAIGDVSGHNLAAGVVMGITKAALLTELKHFSTMGNVIDSLNRTLYDLTERRMFVTLLCALFDPERREVEIANAGHLPLLHYRAAAGVIDQIRPKGLGLGLARETRCQTASVRFEPGDLFLLFTDGLIEATNEKGEELGLERVQDLLRTGAPSMTGAGICRHILAGIERHAGKAPLHDDLTIVAVRVG